MQPAAKPRALAACCVASIRLLAETNCSRGLVVN